MIKKLGDVERTRDAWKKLGDMKRKGDMRRRPGDERNGDKKNGIRKNGIRKIVSMKKENERSRRKSISREDKDKI